ncbi:DUF881 domain-containing protein [Amphibacillus marinus]|nr:DUF881 domain-containing protein [Amphibacillus marinus]
MSKANKLLFSLAIAIIGFMIVLYFNSHDDIEVRDTRDAWEIRSQLQIEQQRQQALQAELNVLIEARFDYVSSSEQQQLSTLVNSVDHLKEEAGMTVRRGAGISIELLLERSEAGIPDGRIMAELIQRLLNELNAYGAEAIAVGNERLVTHTAIREVGDQIYMNQRPLAKPPLTIKVIANDPERLLNYMEVSPSKNEFALHGLSLIIDSDGEVELPAFQDQYKLDLLSVIEENGAGDE